jgi:hypothetical protein
LFPALSIGSISTACSQEVLQYFGPLCCHNLTQHHNGDLLFLLISLYLYLFIHELLSCLPIYLFILYVGLRMHLIIYFVSKELEDVDNLEDEEIDE